MVVIKNEPIQYKRDNNGNRARPRKKACGKLGSASLSLSTSTALKQQCSDPKPNNTTAKFVQCDNDEMMIGKL